MRRWPAAALLSLVVLAFAACETQPLGGRCSYNTECDRSTTAPSATCNLFNSAQMCPGLGSDCVCCPLTVTGMALPGCSAVGPLPTDAGALPDASPDVIADASAAPDAMVGCGVSCPAGSVCSGGACRRLQGTPCATGSECVTTFCASGVCCATACTNPANSCNVSADFAGTCMARPADAGAD